MRTHMMSALTHRKAAPFSPGCTRAASTGCRTRNVAHAIATRRGVRSALSASKPMCRNLRDNWSVQVPARVSPDAHVAEACRGGRIERIFRVA
jgi:hypothetical protein